jgi:hypothetical protein
MATKAQIAANRRNARKSTGPRTTQGKARIRHNSLRHGLRSHDAPPIPGPLLHDLREDLQPATPAEEELIRQLAGHLVIAHRARRLLDAEFDAGEPNAHLIVTLRRYLATTDHSYDRTLENLRNLQQQRQLQEIGFARQKTYKSQSVQTVQLRPGARHPLNGSADILKAGTRCVLNKEKSHAISCT